MESRQEGRSYLISFELGGFAKSFITYFPLAIRLEEVFMPFRLIVSTIKFMTRRESKSLCFSGVCRMENFIFLDNFHFRSHIGFPIDVGDGIEQVLIGYRNMNPKLS